MTKCSEHTRDSTESSDRPVTSPPLLIEPSRPQTDNGPSAGAIPLYHLFNLTSPHLPSQQHDSEALPVSPTPQNVVPASDLPTVANAVDSANQNLIGKKGTAHNRSTHQHPGVSTLPCSGGRRNAAWHRLRRVHAGASADPATGQ